MNDNFNDNIVDVKGDVKKSFLWALMLITLLIVVTMSVWSIIKNDGLPIRSNEYYKAGNFVRFKLTGKKGQIIHIHPLKSRYRYYIRDEFNRSHSYRKLEFERWTEDNDAKDN